MIQPDNAIVKDLGLLKHLFKAKIETKIPPYLALVTRDFDDKDVDNLIEHFRDKDRRTEFFKEYKRNRDALRDHFTRCVSAAVHQ